MTFVLCATVAGCVGDDGGGNDGADTTASTQTDGGATGSSGETGAQTSGVGSSSSGADTNGADSGVTGTDGGDTASTDGSGSSGGSDSGGSTGSTGSDDSGSEGSTGGVALACLESGWDESLEAFEALAQAQGNTYWYTRTSGGSAGFKQHPCTYLTLVAVEDGTIVRREFSVVATDPGYDPDDCEGVAFVEAAAAINDTAELWAYPAYTMEANYAGCCDLLAIEPPEDFDTSFGVDADGVISSCYATHANCADGCGADVDGFNGFTLDTLTWGSPPA